MNTKNQALIASFLIWVVACAPACAALAEATALNAETTGSYPDPSESIDSSPQTTGLLVVDAAIASYELDGVLLERLADHERIRVAAFEEEELREAALFVGLEPGNYRVAGFRGRNSGGTYFVRASDAPMYAVIVVAGKPTYLGRFEAYAEGGQLVVSQMRRAGREPALWKAVARKYSGSSWAGLLPAGS